MEAQLVGCYNLKDQARLVGSCIMPRTYSCRNTSLSRKIFHRFVEPDVEAVY